MVDISIVITLKGDYTHVEAEAFAFRLGGLIVNEIKEKVRQMDLISDGAFLQGWDFRMTKAGLTIFNSQPYADYLEYGTFAYFDTFGLDSFPDTPDPKKKDLDAKGRASFPKGMQPYAVVRKVVWNERLMASLVARALPR